MKIVIVNAHFTKILGGSEVQCHQIAEELTKLGEAVTYVAVGGGDIESMPYKTLGVKRSASDIINACEQLRPDVIYWRYNKSLLSSVMKEIRKLSIPIVFSVSHIHDLQPFAYKPIPNLGLYMRVRRRVAHLIKGFRFQQTFKKVNGVICNNEGHLEYIGHPNKIYIPNSPFLGCSEFNWGRPYVVWVGNIKAHKHPELFVELAGALEGKGVDFLMIGEIQQEAYNYLNNSEELPGNFYYLGAKNVLEANAVIKASLFLVHTCEPEGFPNVFLQAWGFSKPVISLYFDPGDVLLSNNVGRLSLTTEQMKLDTEELLSKPELRGELGSNAQLMIEENFVKEKNIQALLGFLGATIE